MGQKTNPIANRLGIIKGWDSNWYGGKNYVEKIIEDYKIRKYITLYLPYIFISKIYIERTLKLLVIIITTSRPGRIIGKGGKDVETLKEELKTITNKEVKINISEIYHPQLEASLIAKNIAEQVSNRNYYKKAIKLAISEARRLNAEGIKINISGRLNGVEIARTENYKYGRIPLATLRADIDYAFTEARTTYGIIGIKVWLMKGYVYKKRKELSTY